MWNGPGLIGKQNHPSGTEIEIYLVKLKVVCGREAIDQAVQIGREMNDAVWPIEAL